LVRSEEPVRNEVEPFLTPVSLTLGPEPADLHTAPGIFAKGGLDEGSALLLKALESHTHPVTTALDFGCGIGVLAAGVQSKWPDAQITALDADALAIKAFQKSFPNMQSAVGDGWQAFTRLSKPKAGYDLIVSNPPLHRATNTFDPSVMDALIARSPDYLATGGHLIFVTQRQRAVTRALESALGPANLIAESGRFRVWSVRKTE
ncbi:MAG: class I SAM-dependent methyltransferase, partial [Myxococcota bacterium]